ncbi:MAG: 50S ribosomal protein L4 [Mycoplasma sp.]|nr:50S ribosomal protein L4 [Mycoplasma sp.]
MDKKVKLINLKGEVIKEVGFNKDLLVAKIAKQAIFDTVIAEQASKRQGTHSTLTKAEVRGGGRKPFMQKHTGNARQGSIRNPQWVGGGIVFGPKPNRNYNKKVNAKVVHLAFKSVVTEKYNDEKIYLLEDTSIKKPNTKTVAQLLKKLNVYGKKVLFVINKESDVLNKSARNINKVAIKKFNQVSTTDVMNANILVIENKACEELGKVYC